VFPNVFDSKDLRDEFGSGAASALHGAVADFREVTGIDAGLQVVIAAWEVLPEHVRREILAIVASATTESGSEP
jgi:hypothetical protein